MRGYFVASLRIDNCNGETGRQAVRHINYQAEILPDSWIISIGYGPSFRSVTSIPVPQPGTGMVGLPAYFAPIALHTRTEVVAVPIGRGLRPGGDENVHRSNQVRK